MAITQRLMKVGLYEIRNEGLLTDDLISNVISADNIDESNVPFVNDTDDKRQIYMPRKYDIPNEHYKSKYVVYSSSRANDILKQRQYPEYDKYGRVTTAPGTTRIYNRILFFPNCKFSHSVIYPRPAVAGPSPSPNNMEFKPVAKEISFVNKFGKQQTGRFVECFDITFWDAILGNIDVNGNPATTELKKLIVKIVENSTLMFRSDVYRNEEDRIKTLASDANLGGFQFSDSLQQHKKKFPFPYENEDWTGALNDTLKGQWDAPLILENTILDDLSTQNMNRLENPYLDAAGTPLTGVPSYTASISELNNFFNVAPGTSYPYNALWPFKPYKPYVLWPKLVTCYRLFREEILKPIDTGNGQPWLNATNFDGVISNQENL